MFINDFMLRHIQYVAVKFKRNSILVHSIQQYVLSIHVGYVPLVEFNRAQSNM